ncbi:transporter [Caldovatus aquaticus]|uniref:Transporter n=1 Tax=Caldovatus aquaticus TaxID=2865671 RepID=A0ABS7F0L3_9PROT|nr:transporter [Caldovatus aquaticus]MBW8268341.1 transporter [Caldovatus aquaticus]
MTGLAEGRVPARTRMPGCAAASRPAPGPLAGPAALGIALAALLAAAPARAQEAVTVEDLRRLRAMLEQQQRRLEEQDARLARQQRLSAAPARALEGLRRALRAPGPARPPAAPAQAAPGAPAPPPVVAAPAPGAPSAAAPRDPQAPSTAAEAAAVRRREEQRVLATDPTLARVGGVLTPRGVISAESSVEYLYTQNTQAIVNGFSIIPGITFGTVDIRRATQRAAIAALTLRYGITDRLEINARIPWVWRGDTIQTAPADINASPITVSPTGSGLGDVEFGASYQVNDGLDDWPVFIANLRVKSDTGRSPFDVPIYRVTDPQGGFLRGLERELATGTGFWSVEPGVTVAWASDPAVFFGGLRYIWNIGRTVSLQDPAGGPPTRTRLEPGDGVGLNFGVGFALNERTSLSLGYDHIFVMSSRAGGRNIAGSGLDIGSFNFGLSYRASERLSVSLGVSVGATENAPDARIILRVPYRFSL